MMGEQGAPLALQVDEKDNVATVFADGVEAGSALLVRTKNGESLPLTALHAIPYGHKLAVIHIPAGGHIIKYGECIGAASRDIPRGEYVHVHNMEALRGRGDL